MKLHIFDSCPFCTRVKFFADLKGIDLPTQYTGLGVIPVSVQSQISKFVVPILEIEQYSKTEAMVESAEIIKFLDTQQPLLQSYQVSDVIEARLAAMKPITAKLVYPRMLQLSLPELSDPEALKLFVDSRPNVLGMSLEEALDNTEGVVSLMLEQLELLSQELDIASYLSRDREISMDDIAAFSELRNLTMVAELSFPKQLKHYFETLSALASLQSYTRVSK